MKKDEIYTALSYSENNAPRMRYHYFRTMRPVHRLRCKNKQQDNQQPTPQAIRHQLNNKKSRLDHRHELQRGKKDMGSNKKQTEKTEREEERKEK